MLAFATAISLLSVTMSLTELPRAEHPRPDRVRSEWMNLNGAWEFAETDDDGDRSYLTERAFPDKIIVPFCRESSLSGLGRKGFVKNVWYRRTFDAPQWKSKRTLLHIGACDWKTTIWVNGKQVGEHIGGSAPITCDLTSVMKPIGNVVLVHAFDDTRSGLQALGKQCDKLESYGCLYTRTTGIWQTVWLEGAGESFIQDLHVVGNSNGQVSITSSITGDADSLSIRIKDGSQVVASAKSNVEGGEAKAKLVIQSPKLWQPGKAHLYDIECELIKNGIVLDTVTSYVGLRDVTIDGAAILINDKRVFQRLILDQGFYPDGIWTAPSDAALKADIELSLAAGFNGARLHEKVFEPRFLYWADKLGYLVWSEFPNWGLNYNDRRIDKPVIDEWKELVIRDRNHPSVIGWCPFNETPGEAIPLQNKVVDTTLSLDTTRPIIESSGYAHGYPNPMVLDAHDYDQNPESFKNRYDRMMSPSGLPIRYGGGKHIGIPYMVSEYGGIGWDTGTGWGYGNNPKTLEEFYARYKGLTDALLDNRQMFGFCYTQLTDVEQERNGIYTYTRKQKFDLGRIRKITSRQSAYERVGPEKRSQVADTWKVLVGSACDPNVATGWKNTTTPPPSNWMSPDFSDASWYVSPGAFGSKGGYDHLIQSKWDTNEIWLRQQFKWDGKAFKRALLAIHYDNATEVFVNGKLIWKSANGAWNDAYEGIEITDSLRRSIRNGDNVIAVHCHQDSGGQFIDLALIVSGV